VSERVFILALTTSYSSNIQTPLKASGALNSSVVLPIGRNASRRPNFGNTHSTVLAEGGCYLLVNENQASILQIVALNAPLPALLQTGQVILDLTLPKLLFESRQHSPPFQIPKDDLVADSAFFGFWRQRKKRLVDQ